MWIVIQEPGAAPAASRENNFMQRLRKLKKVFQFLPIRKGFSNFTNVYLSYQPDSHQYFACHPEFGRLYASFVQGNVKNNGGDIARLWAIILNCKQMENDGIKGAFAELGVWRGNTAAVLAFYASQQGRQAFFFDTYEGFDARDIKGVDEEKKIEFSDTSIDYVKNVIGAPVECCSFVKGFFPSSLTQEHERGSYALVSLDCDLYEPMKAGLDFFYPRMPKGGLFMLHDYSSQFWVGAKLAIDEFCRHTGEYVVLMPDKSGSAFLRKTK
jgi:hypothetical protein